MRPWDRHHTDIVNHKRIGKLNGALAAFLAALESLLPGVHQSARVWSLSDVPSCLVNRTPLAPGRDSAELVEEYFIAWLGLECLLNRRIGNSHDLVPSMLLDDQLLFETCRTNIFYIFASKKQCHSRAIIADLQSLFSEIQSFSNHNHRETDGAKSPIDNKCRDDLLRVATPYAISGNTIALFVGQQIPDDDKFHRRTFMTSRSRSAVYTRRCI